MLGWLISFVYISRTFLSSAQDLPQHNIPKMHTETKQRNNGNRTRKHHSHIRITIPTPLIQRKRARIPKELFRQVVTSLHFVDVIGTCLRGVGAVADEDLDVFQCQICMLSNRAKEKDLLTPPRVLACRVSSVLSEWEYVGMARAVGGGQ